MKPEPFLVFISSNQREFQSLRDDLQKEINKQTFHDQQLMRAIRIEDEHGSVNMENITDKVDKSSVYVGIFGRRESPWTFAECLAARARCIPLLIYYYKKPVRRGRPKTEEKRGRRSEVMKFLEKEVKSYSVTINGYSKPYTSAAQLMIDILNHLAMQISEMVAEAARVRKTIHKAMILPVS